MQNDVSIKPKANDIAYNSKFVRNSVQTTNRILICSPSLGIVRMEWVLARHGQVIPCNWSQVQIVEFMSEFVPLEYQVADARNVCCNAVVERNFEWLLFIDDDVCLPPETFIILNEYMTKGDIPVVSGLYFTKSNPPEPLIYRGRGTGFYKDWKKGDKVWVDGVPMGCTLISGKLIKAMWEESEEYRVGNTILHRVFETPARVIWDPEKINFRTETGTEDLTWCTRVMNENFLEKSGWEKHAKDHAEFPFLINTRIWCQHIDPNGRQFPGLASWDNGLIFP